MVTGKLSGLSRLRGKIPISSKTSGKSGPGVTVMVDWTFRINHLSVHDVTQRMAGVIRLMLGRVFACLFGNG